ncbi:RNA methyltransferase [Bacillus tianshenii]|nr:RNA methyltransferase [Bacillus tianshenii]
MKHIQSAKNNHVKHWKSLHQKKHREDSKSYLIEGAHLVEEAATYNVPFEAILVQDDQEIPSFLQNVNTEVYLVSKDVMKAVSDTKTPQGIAAVCKMNSDEVGVKLDGTKLLLVDGVQDPGNLGTLIRTADAVGLDGVIAGEGCADLYNSKVIRSTQGSLFHLPVIKGNLSEWVDRLREADVPVFGSALDNAVPYAEIEAPESFALIVGNEGSGVQPALLEQTTQNLYVPIHGHAESLNVAIACGVLLYHLRG